MFTPTTQLSSRSKVAYSILIFFIIAWMAAYPIYTNYYRGLAIEQYERFLDWKADRSMFYNPWQYRILCYEIVEGTYQVLDHTVFKLIHFAGPQLNLPGNTGDKNEVTQKMLRLAQQPEFIKYTIVFVGFRFLQNALIFFLAFQYFSHFLKSRSIVLLSIMFIPFMMGNAVVDSDLSFNTYMDVTLYLLAGLVIVKGYSDWWIVPLTILGALNRETSLMIPAIYFCSKVDWSKWPDFKQLFFTNFKPWIVAAVSMVFFVVIFAAIRMHFGYRPQTDWRVPAGLPMLKLNLFSSVSVKTYMEMYGVFGFLPIWCLFLFKEMNQYLKIFFIVIVPVWFGIHLFSVVAYQSRLYLVPTLLIFLPVVLQHIENQIQARQRLA
ncbi:hypothetical protein [Chryseolinea lacunae]|uniref:Glycosyltransferase RgtA/B/C/D-like domain-containing protein n=1 Tax=Chryseolinea lacunae TaxID=2801331 RepID=A0ABS1L114_9BACT|nr:hypothetical protein [Chryseolinea lacunae]MBL0744246.1 hypothetical protein [Chryseolinea lacunae]